MTATAVIPAHPPRVANGLLGRAVQSVLAQSLPVDAISIAIDNERRGAWHTRQRALEAVNTDWTLFLDSDDEWLPHHHQIHREWAAAHDADIVYSWFQIIPETCVDPFPEWFFTEPWDPERPRHTTMTIMVKTELAQSIGFTPFEPGAAVGNEDWRFLQECFERKSKIVHIPNERSWLWHWDPPDGNTSGLPTRWGP